MRELDFEKKLSAAKTIIYLLLLLEISDIKRLNALAHEKARRNISKLFQTDKQRWYNQRVYDYVSLES